MYERERERLSGRKRLGGKGERGRQREGDHGGMENEWERELGRKRQADTHTHINKERERESARGNTREKENQC